MKSMTWIVAIFAIVLLSACNQKPLADAEESHDHAAEASHDDANDGVGEHGGRLLHKDGITVELALQESASEPRYQAWLYRDEKPLPPSAGTLNVQLQRLGGQAEQHALVAQSDGSLLASSAVAEPHSFYVTVSATVEGKSVGWTYANYEGRAEIDRDIADESGIRVASVGPGTVADEHEMQGLLTPVEGRTAKVMARFPGPIRRLDAKVGDSVAAGRVLASIESNLSLTTYTVKAPISGVVLSRDASIGGVANEGMALFEIADLSSLWVDLHIFGADAQHIRAGVPVKVTRMSDGVTADTVLDRILPGTATASQSTVARATIANADGLWRPGSAVKARITVEQQAAALVVPLTALQSYRDADVVFVRVGDVYEARPVELGKRDARQVEVLSGIKAGDEIVTEQSYLLKADIEKSGASHEH